MFRNVLMSIMFGCAVAFGIPSGTLAQETTAKEDAKKAGQEASQAGKKAGQAAKHAGKAAAKGTTHVVKKAGHATKEAAKRARRGTNGTKKAAKRVKRKLTPHTVRAACKDGTVQSGKTRRTACVDHGGVRG